MSAKEQYLNSPVMKKSEPMTVLFYFPGSNKTESCEIDGRVFEAIKAGADSAGIGIGEFISQAIMSTKGGKPKASKNYIMVNMPSWEQKKLRDLANRSGVRGRGGIAGIMKYWVLQGVKQELQMMADVLSKTGKSVHELGLVGSPTMYQTN